MIGFADGMEGLVVLMEGGDVQEGTGEAEKETER